MSVEKKLREEIARLKQKGTPVQRWSQVQSTIPNKVGNEMNQKHSLKEEWLYAEVAGAEDNSQELEQRDSTLQNDRAQFYKPDSTIRLLEHEVRRHEVDIFIIRMRVVAWVVLCIENQLSLTAY